MFLRTLGLFIVSIRARLMQRLFDDDADSIQNVVQVAEHVM